MFTNPTDNGVTMPSEMDTVEEGLAVKVATLVISISSLEERIISALSLAFW